MTEPHHCTSGHVELFRPGALTVWTFEIVVMAVVTDHFTVVQAALPLYVTIVGLLSGLFASAFKLLAYGAIASVFVDVLGIFGFNAAARQQLFSERLPTQ